MRRPCCCTEVQEWVTAGAAHSPQFLYEAEPIGLSAEGSYTELRAPERADSGSATGCRRRPQPPLGCQGATGMWKSPLLSRPNRVCSTRGVYRTQNGQAFDGRLWGTAYSRMPAIGGHFFLCIPTVLLCI